ncbi:MAG TPA: sigma-70 family RNA polymerase sigma factor [Phycisphaerae bacterium]|nr:sigma-70 family RNA polymerase sigma factor [Phycisphaerae bacterium]
MDDSALAELIRGAQSGDPASFDRLVEQFATRIFGFLFRMTGSRHDAEDLMQEVFVRVVRTIGSYKHDGRFESWLFRIAANLARDRLRRLKRAPKMLGGMLAPSGDGDQGTSSASLERAAGVHEPADAALTRGEEMDALNAALAKLPAGEREVLMLRHFSQLSFKEIAQAVGCPLGTALARAHRGLAHLRGLMGAVAHSGARRDCMPQTEGTSHDTI